MLEARTSAMRYGTGLTPTSWHTTSVTGAIRSTVVTLSSAVDATPHHPEQQEQDVPVDRGRLVVEDLVRVEDPGGDDDPRAAQGRGDPMDPLGRDQDIGAREHRDRQPHRHEVGVTTADRGGRAATITRPGRQRFAKIRSTSRGICINSDQRTLLH